MNKLLLLIVLIFTLIIVGIEENSVSAQCQPEATKSLNMDKSLSNGLPDIGTNIMKNTV